ncbi:MAG: hypothetical protein H3C31_00575 [Brumimicrobium sp.]|nr:hypothetical protein [Brumimicrobium sp.]MCO5268136.1 LPS assembly lipoprotein LptE [Brumimicrobium sp.]
MIRRILYILVLFLLSSCWPTSVSFRDGSVPPEWKSFMINTLEGKAPNAPISYASQLTEELKDGVQNRLGLRLVVNESEKPQIIINGSIDNYSVTPLSLQDNTSSVKNRLTIRASFEIAISEPKEDVMKLTSSRFADFDASQDVGSVQAQLLEEIDEQIVQDVLNKLLSNW